MLTFSNVLECPEHDPWHFRFAYFLFRSFYACPLLLRIVCLLYNWCDIYSLINTNGNVHTHFASYFPNSFSTVKSATKIGARRHCVRQCLLPFSTSTSLIASIYSRSLPLFNTLPLVYCFQQSWKMQNGGSKVGGPVFAFRVNRHWLQSALNSSTPVKCLSYKVSPHVILQTFITCSLPEKLASLPSANDWTFNIWHPCNELTFLSVTHTINERNFSKCRR